MEEKLLAKRLGNIIRLLRQEAQLSQEAFADYCGLHRTYIGAVERGEKTITISTAEKIARALGLSLAQLFLKLEQEQKSFDQSHGG